MTGLALPLLLLLCLQGNAKDQDCEVKISLKRDTLLTASIMDNLTISCPVVHCGSKLEVKWCKFTNERVCTRVNETEHIKIEQRERNHGTEKSFLQFVHISMNDTGLYRCEIFGNLSSVSHAINVSVIAAKDTGHSQSNETITTPPPNGPNEDRSDPLGWLYISITAGVLLLTVIAVVTFYMLRSKGKRTQDRLQRDLQSSAPLKKEEPPQTSLPASPRPRLPDHPMSVRSPHPPRPPSVRSSCVYDNAPAPAGRSSRTKRAPAREAPPPSGNRGSARPVPAGRDGVYDNEREEAENPIVYAALDHQVVRKGSSLGNTYVPMEEFTEYAAIRLS